MSKKDPLYPQFDGMDMDEAVRVIHDWFTEHGTQSPPKKIHPEFLLGPKTGPGPRTADEIAIERYLHEHGFGVEKKSPAERAREELSKEVGIEVDEHMFFKTDGPLRSFPLSDLYPDGELPEGITSDEMLNPYAEGYARIREILGEHLELPDVKSAEDAFERARPEEDE